MGIMTSLREFNVRGNPLSKHPPEVVEAAMMLQQRTTAWHSGMAPSTPLSLWLLRTRSARITKSFDASEFSLLEVPKELLGLTQMHLVHLQLERNLLGEVPASLALLSTLTHVDLSHNKLRTVPTSIGDCHDNHHSIYIIVIIAMTTTLVIATLQICSTLQS